MRLVPIALALIHSKDCLESYCQDQKKEKVMAEIDRALDALIESETPAGRGSIARSSPPTVEGS